MMENFKVSYSRTSQQWQLSYWTVETQGKGKKKIETDVEHIEWFPTESAVYRRLGEL